MSTSRDITLDEVRNYILESGTMEEAEAYLRTGKMQAISKPNAPSSAVASIKDRIVTSRDAQREEIIKSLVSKKHEGALSMLREEEEMKQLQILESKLRDEHLAMETSKQKLALQMKDKKRQQLDELSREIENELLQVERQREALEMSYAKKQVEISKLQQELHAAEASISNAAPNTTSQPSPSTLTLAQHKDAMSQLALEHAQKVAMTMNYLSSAQHDKQRIERGVVDIESLTQKSSTASMPTVPSIRSSSTPMSPAASVDSTAALSTTNPPIAIGDINVQYEEEKLQQLIAQHSTPSQPLPSASIATPPLQDSLEKWLMNDVPLETILKPKMDKEILLQQIKNDVLKQTPPKPTTTNMSSPTTKQPPAVSIPDRPPRVVSAPVADKPVSSFFQRQRPSHHQVNAPYNNPYAPSSQPIQPPHFQQQQPQQFQYPPSYPNPYAQNPYVNSYTSPYPNPYQMQPTQPYVQPQPLANPTSPAVPDKYYSQLEQLANQLEAENKKYGAMLSEDAGGSDGRKKNSVTDATPGGQQERLTKQDLAHRESLKAIQYEIERLQQTQILEELKLKLENEKSQREAELKHNEWLNEQKRQLQSLKITQALEQEKIKGEQIRKEMTQTTTTDSTATLKLDTKPKLTSIQFNLDGVLLPRHMISGESYRTVTGIYDDATATVLSRLQASSWQDWQNSNDGTKPDDVALEHCSINRKIPKSKSSTAKVKILIEIQCRNSSNVQRPVSWALVGSYSIGEDDVVAADQYYMDGCWRVAMRKGVADPKQSFQISLIDASPAIALVRFTNANDKATVAPTVSTVAEANDVYKSPSLEAKKPTPTPSRPPTSTMRLPRAESKVTRQESRMPRSRPVTAESKAESKLEATPSMSSLSSNNSAKLRSAVKGLQFLERAQADKSVDGDAKQDMSSIAENSESESDNGEEVELLTNKHWQMGSPTTVPTEKYQAGDGVDVYIDAGMNFPEHCTIIRIVVKVLTNDCSVVGTAYESYGTLDSTTISPTFNFKVELRGAVFNVTNTVLVRIDTIDAVSLDTVGVGYSAIKLFCNRERKQPAQNNNNEIFINTGLYQLPIYGGRFKPGGVMTEDRLSVTKMPKLPCSTLLVRIVAAPRSSDGLLILSKKDFPASDWERLKLHIPAPSYSSGAYDGRLCEPTAAEIKAYDARSVCVARSPEAAFTQAVSMWADYDLPAQIKPKKPNNAANTLTWLSSNMVPAATLSHISKYQFVVPYSFDIGVSVAVEQLYNLPDVGLLGSKDVLYNVIYSCNPPGLFYRDLPLVDGVHFTSSIKPSSYLRALQYETLFRTFNPPVVDEKLTMIFDVRPIKLDFNKLENNYDVSFEPPSKRKPYWTLLPLGAEIMYRDGYRYVLSGVFQLPLIEGSVPQSVLTSKQPFKDVIKMLGDRNSGLKLVDTSVIVKVVHPSLTALYEDVFTNWEDNIDTSFMQRMIRAAATASTIKQETFTYDNSRFMNSKTIEKQFNKVDDVKKLLKTVTAKFAEATQILHDAV